MISHNGIHIDEISIRARIHMTHGKFYIVYDELDVLSLKIKKTYYLTKDDQGVIFHMMTPNTTIADIEPFHVFGDKR